MQEQNSFLVIMLVVVVIIAIILYVDHRLTKHSFFTDSTADTPPDHERTGNHKWIVRDGLEVMQIEWRYWEMDRNWDVVSKHYWKDATIDEVHSVLNENDV